MDHLHFDAEELARICGLTVPELKKEAKEKEITHTDKNLETRAALIFQLLKLESADRYFKGTVTGILEKKASELKQVLSSEKTNITPFLFNDNEKVPVLKARAIMIIYYSHFVLCSTIQDAAPRAAPKPRAAQPAAAPKAAADDDDDGSDVEIMAPPQHQQDPDVMAVVVALPQAFVDVLGEDAVCAIVIIPPSP